MLKIREYFHRLVLSPYIPGFNFLFELLQICIDCNNSK